MTKEDLKPEATYKRKLSDGKEIILDVYPEPVIQTGNASIFCRITVNNDKGFEWGHGLWAKYVSEDESVKSLDLIENNIHLYENK